MIKALKKEAMENLQAIIDQDMSCPVEEHYKLDRVIVNLLRKEGYEEVVELYDSVWKYYG